MRLLGGTGDARALYDGARDRWWTAAELDAAVARVAEQLRPGARGLAFCLAGNDVPSVIGYLAALAAGHAVALWAPDPRLEIVERLMAAYDPELLLATREHAAPGRTWSRVDTGAGELAVARAPAADRPPLHPDLTLLLATSGSTGNPKLVRLSGSAVRANARSIREALGIGAADVAVTALPLHYTYGLSVLHSHLVAGAAVAVTGEGPLAERFWTVMRDAGCTSMAGVPYTYQVLQRLDLERLNVPRLVTMTLSGGRLAPELVLKNHERMSRRGGRFFKMYGITEATARIAVLPHDRLPDRIDSVGRAVPGGALSIEAGEVVYRGPNVMMGYATSRGELARGDELGGRLATGDLGRLDDEGFLFLTGRARRIAKLTGVRVNLDDVEARIAIHAPCAAVARDERLLVFVEGLAGEVLEARRRELALALGVNATLVELRAIERIPRTGSGKVDYAALEQLG